MSDSSVARRYARALHEEAQAEKRAGEVGSDMDMVGDSLSSSRELRLLFESPVVSREKKKVILSRLFDGRVSPLVVRFMKLVVDKGREHLFPAIVQAYRQLRDEEEGIAEIKVQSAQPLSTKERERLSGVLVSLTKRKIRLLVDVDPRLLGGLVVRIGDVVYDGSLHHRLVGLRDRLERGTYLNN